jgi:hypothetical protein
VSKAEAELTVQIIARPAFGARPQRYPHEAEAPIPWKRKDREALVILAALKPRAC